MTNPCFFRESTFSRTLKPRNCRFTAISVAKHTDKDTPSATKVSCVLLVEALSRRVLQAFHAVLSAEFGVIQATTFTTFPRLASGSDRPLAISTMSYRFPIYFRRYFNSCPSVSCVLFCSPLSTHLLAVHALPNSVARPPYVLCTHILAWEFTLLTVSHSNSLRRRGTAVTHHIPEVQTIINTHLVGY